MAERLPPWPQRPSGLAAALVTALVVTSGAVVWLMQRDRQALVDEFRSSGREQVQEIAAEAEDAFDDIGEDLAFATALVDGADAIDRSRELGALLAVVRQYRVVEVYGAAGNVVSRVVEPPPSRLDPAPFTATMAATAREALGRRGELVTSGKVDNDDSGWFRVFARGFGDGRGAVAILVDTRPLFQQLRVVSVDKSTRVLLLGAFGNPLPLSDDVAVRVLDDAGLRAQLIGPDAGALQIDERDARSKGIANADVVVSWAPIPLEGGQHWTVATLRSTEDLRSRVRALVVRIVVVLVVVFVAFVVVGRQLLRSAQAALVLRERLQHAEREGALQTELLRAEKLATVGVLAAGMAHEIGTPLGVIRGRAEFIAGKLGDDHPMVDGVKTIVAQSDRVTRLIQELLDFANPRPSQPLPTSLSVVSQQAAQLLRFSDRARGVVVDVDVPAGLPLLAADPDHLQQVLVNLGMNAVDACADAWDGKGGHVVVRAEFVAGADTVDVVVEDDGKGIAPDLVHRVFDPFFTTKKRGRGTGLGLTVVARILQSHGAHLRLDSTPGKGTRVVLSWPISSGEPR